MVDVERTFTVQAAMEEVVAYLRDFAHTEAWDPGTVSCSQVGDGPIVKGTQWHNTSKFLVFTTELTYTLTVDEPDHLVFTGVNKTATTSDDLSFAPDPAGGGTRITYHASVEFNGAAKLGEPIAALAFKKLADETQHQLTATLEDVVGR
ncbi:SRPBCC family protein [Gordonia jinhuaensis]|uniref:Polyketide cyclase n=1 Tax=Gordonia jinhuaensis TaxID=1517702 RepID=A0A916TBL4_9ACTN|nr:SRPBCC family protein [Gordonia jinhuaensis]GGB37131.1 polyketide cyclase [Gordonia jinhuaensis]